MRIGVIGAGAAGLCAIKHALSFGCEVIAFEQSENIGGTWVYSDAVGKDKYGNDIHSSMFKGVRTNLPKELMLFPDLPFPHQEKSFVNATDVNDYLSLYADKFQLRTHIKFEHRVLRVQPVSDTDMFELIALNFSENKYETHFFDCVLACNGHFSVPSVPNFKGRKLFNGKQMHSHDYRTPQPFAGKQVLVIGAGPSGVDISQEIAQQAEMVFWSNHLSPPKVLAVENLVQKPDVKELTKHGANFTDGSCERFDVIVYCTGYKYSYPFLSIDCGLLNDDSYVRPLFKHCLSINHPRLGLIGIPVNVCPFQMFDLQIRFCLTFMTRRKDLPLKEEMLQDTEREMNERWLRGLSKRKAHAMGKGIQDKYYADLAVTASITPIKPVMTKMYDESKRHQTTNFANYRQMQFSVIDDDNFTAKILP